jgi:hypothetical protein
MMERLSATPVPPPSPTPQPVETIDAIRADLLGRIAPAIAAVWPKGAPLVEFDITLSTQGVSINAQYRGHRDLSPIALELIAGMLKDKLNMPSLVLEAHRIRLIGRRRSFSQTHKTK